MLFPFHCPKYDTRGFFAQEKTLLPGWLLDAKLAAREPPQEVAPLLPDRQVIYETELGSAAEEARRVLGQTGLSSSEDETQLSDLLMLLLMMPLWMEEGSEELSSSPWHREGEGARGRGQGEARQRRRGQGKGPLISVERGEGPKHCDHHMIPRLLF